MLSHSVLEIVSLPLRVGGLRERCTYIVCWLCGSALTVVELWPPLPYLHGSGAGRSLACAVVALFWAMSIPKEYEGIVDSKYPWWDGNWSTYEDYKTRVELRADACKEDDLPFLGPRLASNLVGKAFDTLGEIKREQLKKAQGWHYLLTFLEEQRGRAKVDILGDTFTEFFLKRDACRRDGEEINDYENRFKILMRRMERALAETNASAKMPPEVYGWFLLNVFMRMSPSDAANIRGKASSYKVDDVLTALRLMWSSGGLGNTDAEIRPRKTTSGHAYHQDEGYAQQDADPEPEETEEILELQEWCDEAAAELLADTEDNAEILANFKEARRALDQARTARGFYPVRPPGQSQNRGKASQFSKSQAAPKRESYSSDADKTCFRCGKKGHTARRCPQRPSGSGGSSIGYVGWCESVDPSDQSAHPEVPIVTSCDQPEVHMVTTVLGHSQNDSAPHPSPEVICSDPNWVLCSQEVATGQILALHSSELRGKAIVDSGASDNIVGAETLQDLAECLEEMDFEPEHEIKVDRQIHKRFIFGNGESSSGLGLSHVNAGICGKEVTIQSHLVEGKTPFLLSSKFLYDMDVTINFRTGKALFKTLSSQQIQLERTESNHLLIPLTAFAGHQNALENLFVSDEDFDGDVHTLSRSDPDLLEQPASDPRFVAFDEATAGDQGTVDE